MPCPHSTSDEPCPECAKEAALSDPTLVRGEPATPEAPPLQDPALKAGERVGRYILLEVLGEGGMGVVYSAFDPELERKVAIKLVGGREGSDPSSSENQARLLREAQAMAQLSHPNVVPIHDVGRFGTSVFIAMEQVKGQTLHTWLKAEPRAWRQVVDVFVAAGRGLQAAHDAGLIHRDFKPGNVLIGRDGRVRVTDFGLARPFAEPVDRSQVPLPAGPRTEGRVSLRTPLTRIRGITGTPAYMAPEQFGAGEATPASDQFSFCVALYEALYGVRPFAGESAEELARTTLGEEPAAPPKGATAPAWLWALLSRGLNKSPKARHPSMAALLGALEAGAKGKGRRVAWVAGGLAVAAAGVALASFSRSQAAICRDTDSKLEAAWGDAAQRRIQEAFEATGKSFASEAWRATREQLDGWSGRWRQAREQACDASALRTGEGARRLERRLTCLDRRLDEFTALTGALAKADADLVARAGASAASLSDLSTCSEARNLTDAREALPSAQKAVLKELDAHLARARGLFAAGQTRQAVEELEPALAAAQPIGFQPALVEPRLALGSFRDNLHAFAKAKEDYAQAAQAAQASGRDEDLAAALVGLVEVVGPGLAQQEEANTLADLARATLQRLGGNASIERRLLRSLGNLAWRVGNRDEAVKDLQAALAVSVPASRLEDFAAGQIHCDLGWVLMELGRLDEAEQEENRALSLRAGVVGEKSPTLSAIWNSLGAIFAQKGDDAKSIQSFEKALELREAADATSPNLVAPLGNLAQALVGAGQSARALPYLDRAQAILAAQPEMPEIDAAQVELYRATALRLVGRTDQALQSSEQALARVERLLPKDHSVVCSVLREKALALDDLGRHAEALTVFERALPIAAKQSDISLKAEVSAEAAGALLGLQRWNEAREKLEPALPVMEKESRADRLAEARLRMAEALWHTPSERKRALGFAHQAAESDGSLATEPVRARARTWLTRHAL